MSKAHAVEFSVFTTRTGARKGLPSRFVQSFRTAGCSGTGQPEVAGYVLTAVAPMRANVPGKIMAALA